MVYCHVRRLDNFWISHEKAQKAQKNTDGSHRHWAILSLRSAAGPEDQPQRVPAQNRRLPDERTAAGRGDPAALRAE